MPVTPANPFKSACTPVTRYSPADPDEIVNVLLANVIPRSCSVVLRLACTPAVVTDCETVAYARPVGAWKVPELDSKAVTRVPRAELPVLTSVVLVSRTVARERRSVSWLVADPVVTFAPVPTPVPRRSDNLTLP